MTVRATAISGRCWSVRTPPAAALPPEAQAWFAPASPEIQSPRKNTMKTIALIAATALALPFAAMAQTATATAEAAAKTTAQEAQVVPRAQPRGSRKSSPQPKKPTSTCRADLKVAEPIHRHHQVRTRRQRDTWPTQEARLLHPDAPT